MPHTCSANGCTNRFGDPNKKLHFHGFPLNDKDILSKWLHAVKRKGFKPKKWSKLCNEHFLETDYEILPGFKRACLKKGVIPSIFPEIPERLVKKSTPRRTKTSCNGVVDNASGSAAVIDECNDSIGVVSVFPCETKCDMKVQTDVSFDNFVKLENTVKTLKNLVNGQQQQINQLRSTVKALRTELEELINSVDES